MISIISKVVYFFVMFFVLSSNVAICQDHKSYYLIGEDVYIDNSILMCVNTLNKLSKAGGGLTSKFVEELTAEITLVNYGSTEVIINPKTQFKLLTANKKKLEPSQINNSNILQEFSLHPNTQSRVSLSFTLLEVDPIKLDDNEYLCFELNSKTVYVICDPNLPKLVEAAKSQLLLAEDGLKLSNYYCKNNDYISARKILENSIGRSGYDPRLILQIAYIEETLGNNESAKSYLQLLENKDNLTSEIILSASEKAYALNYYELVVKLLQQLYYSNQLKGKYLFILAKSYYFLKNYQTSQKLLSEITNNNFENKEVLDCTYFTLGNIEEKYNNYIKAIEYWNKALEITPSYYEAWFNIGVGYYKLGNLDKAKHAWNMVLQLSPDIETKNLAEKALANLE